MAGGELWGVWVQTITNDTTAANVEKYGEIEDMAQAYRDGFAKDFCDGQTSPTPPRWPDDGMQLVYTYDQESARLISEFLREDVAARVAEGEMGGGFAVPSWLDGLVSSVYTSGMETAAITGGEEMIELTGTERQIAAAETIRAERISEIALRIQAIEDQIAYSRLKHPERPESRYAERLQHIAALRNVSEGLRSESSAAWFLDHSGKDIDWFMFKFNSFNVMPRDGGAWSLSRLNPLNRGQGNW